MVGWTWEKKHTCLTVASSEICCTGAGVVIHQVFTHPSIETWHECTFIDIWIQKHKIHVNVENNLSAWESQSLEQLGFDCINILRCENVWKFMQVYSFIDQVSSINSNSGLM